MGTWYEPQHALLFFEFSFFFLSSVQHFLVHFGKNLAIKNKLFQVILPCNFRVLNLLMVFFLGTKLNR